MILPKSVVRQEAIAGAVEELEKRLPNVKKIYFKVDQDWTGTWALFLGIVLSNAAMRKIPLSALADEVTNEASKFFDAKDLELQVYYSFRSEAEQRTRDVESWL